MNQAQNFHDEIEKERLWVATKQGEYVFFSMLPLVVLLVYGLWDTSSHTLLLFWFFWLVGINFIRWRVLRYYNTHKEVLFANTNKFKHLILLGSSVTGLCWGMCFVFFGEPGDPQNMLIICVTMIFEIVGAMLIWFCYLPAVILISLPPSIVLVLLLAMQGEKILLATSAIIFLATIALFTSSLRLAGMLNHTLRLNFEKEVLRHESEEKSMLLETALENMSQGISMSDKNDQLRMWNEQFIKFLGATGSNAEMNTSLTSLLLTAEPPLPMLTEGHQEYCLPDGRVYEVRQSQLGQGGRVLTYTDISDLKKREQALERARKEAEQANAAKTRFLAAASHDLRQPIHALGLFFAELSDRIKDSENSSLISQINDAISAITSMLNALLDISKLDAGIVKTNNEVFSLSELFLRLQAEFQPIAQENHNELRFRSTSAKVNSDSTMLERMLRNLIGNALKHTDHGRILVAARQRENNVEIQIIDTGSGIPEDKLDEIFIEFHQLRNPARDRRQGLGLGLAIVKRLANLLHHEIKVVSRPGHGSCFSVILPLANNLTMTEIPKQNEKIAHVNATLAGRRILVLEDDIAVLESMQGLLARWECQVFTAVSLDEALQIIETKGAKLDMLIVDYRLPGNISGIDMARNIQNRLNYSLPVLVITGDTGPERLWEAETSGFPLLHKPVQPSKLRSSMQYLISKFDEESMRS